MISFGQVKSVPGTQVASTSRTRKYRRSCLAGLKDVGIGAGVGISFGDGVEESICWGCFNVDVRVGNVLLL